MSMEHPTEIIIPDLFTLTPFTYAGQSTIFEADKRESTEWMLSYGIFVDLKRARMKGSNAELLGSYAFAYANADRLRICCDFLMILFVLDEITDAQDAKGANETRDTFVKALTGEAVDDSSPVTKFTKE